MLRLAAVRWGSVVFAMIAAGSSVARAGDVFQFSDIKGYERCLRQDVVVESHQSGDDTTHRLVDQTEINEKCIGHARELLQKKPKDAAFAKEMVQTTVQVTTEKTNAIWLLGAIFEHDVKACNDSNYYAVLLRALQTSTGSDPEFKEAKKVVSTCLKDADFKKDFSEEGANNDATIKKNACAILKAHSIKGSCDS
jgi:hypothetical protein